MVHIVDKQYVEKINKTTATLPPNQREIELANLTPVESVKISVPGVKEAKIRMESLANARLFVIVVSILPREQNSKRKLINKENIGFQMENGVMMKTLFFY